MSRALTMQAGAFESTVLCRYLGAKAPILCVLCTSNLTDVCTCVIPHKNVD